MKTNRIPMLRGIVILVINLLILLAPFARAQTYEKVISFTDALRNSAVPGASSWAQAIEGIMAGPDGNVYGTTVLHPGATIFRMTPDREITTIKEFAAVSGSIRLMTVGLNDRNLYGITFDKNGVGLGTVFKLSQEGSFTSLVEFTGTAGPRPGRNPDLLLQADDGFLYGSTLAGGANGHGVIYRISAGGSGFEILADFSGTAGPRKGKTPNCLFDGLDGNVYGMTRAGGANDLGTVFKIARSGAFSTSVDFSGVSGPQKGAAPVSMIQAYNGNLYGTTSAGGTANKGVIFKLTPQGQYLVIHEFTNETPEFDLLRHPSGDIYGVTDKSVFRITTTDGFEPVAGLGYQSDSGYTYYSASSNLVVGADDNLYLSTDPGPYSGRFDSNGGDVLQITPNGAITLCCPGTFVFWSFSDYVSILPSEPKNLIALPNGTILGVTFGGIDYRLGFQGGGPAGTLFDISLPNIERANIQYFGITRFPNTPAHPQDAVLQGRGNDPNFYGTSVYGGYGNLGTVFKLAPTGESTTLHSFQGVNGIVGYNTIESGRHPTGDLIEDQNGFLRGATRAPFSFLGEPAPLGFSCSKGGDFTPWSSTFSRGEDGDDFTSRRGLTVAGNGVDVFGVYPSDGYDENGFGIRSWKIFKKGPDDLRQDLASLEAPPGSTMLEVNDPGGAFYLGTTLSGGIHGNGTVYKLSPSVMNPVSRMASLDNSGGTFVSTPAWLNISIGTRSDRFSVSFQLTPGAAGMDGVVGLSNGSAQSYDDMPCTLRLNPMGRFDAINYAWPYQARNPLNYVVGQTYEVVMTVDFASRTYSAWVDGILIADNYAFREGHAGTTAVNTLVIKCENGSHTVAGVNLLKQGSYPLGALIRGSDLNFYGTTSYGGAFGFGTIYKMSPAGVITKLVDFTGNGATHKGSFPIAGLVEHQGAFYGTTSAGGVGDLGTIFRMTPDGTFDTIFDFSADPEDSVPMGRLIVGFEGNLYGTTSGSGDGAGSVYRLVFDGAPAIYPFDPPPKSLDQATVKAKINPRGRVSSATVEYWADGVSIASLPLAGNLAGRRSLELACTLPNLRRGKTYSYRFRAWNTMGEETESPVLGFSTYPFPDVSVLRADPVLATSAKLNGTVNPLGESTTVSFELGTDGIIFEPVAGPPGSLAGNTPVPVSAFVPDLVSGTTYYYRIVANNVGGKSESSVMAFTTSTEPEVLTLEAVPDPDYTTRVRVMGKVDPKGSDAKVTFQYREKGGMVDPISIPAVPGEVRGSGLQDVELELRALDQGKTYEYRAVAVNASDGNLKDEGDWRSFTLKILSGLNLEFPDPPPTANGSLTIHFSPATLGAWRFVGEDGWRLSGEAATHLAGGSRTIEFLPIPGYTSPSRQTLPLSGSAGLSLIRSYSAPPNPGTGSLKVILRPDDVTAAHLPDGDRARWQIAGRSGWLESGHVESGLPAGVYRIVCSTLVGTPEHIPPQVETLAIGVGENRSITREYTLRTHTLSPVSYSGMLDEDNPRLAHVGQVRTRAGSGSGFAVKPQVVATVGHAVFDDKTMSYISEVRWLHQRYAGEHEPVALTARGYYLLSGYAKQRREDGTVGASSPAAQNRDCAALFFLQNVARSGFSGFLASEAGTENEFLATAGDKFLAGYPVEGVLAGDLGKPHASPVFADALQLASGETWTSESVLGAAGCSGGPLFVRHSNGSFYPAAIYLGGTGRSVVRAIDRELVDLFDRAQLSAPGGDDGTGGGLSYTNYFEEDSVPTGTIRLLIEPQRARQEATWTLAGDGAASAPRHHDDTLENLQPGFYSIEMAPLPGFKEPQPIIVDVSPGVTSTFTYTFVAPDNLEDWRRLYFGSPANSGSGADDADPDGDGAGNLDEFTAGTRPDDPADAFRVASCGKIGNSFVVELAGNFGRSYVLERKSGLQNNNWTEVTRHGPLTANTDLTLTDLSPPPGQAFYRVKVQKP